jgi:hypothetical protein
VCEYSLIAATLTISRHCAWETLPVVVGDALGSGGVWSGLGSGVGRLRQLCGGKPVPLPLQHVWGYFTVPFFEGKHPAE